MYRTLINFWNVNFIIFVKDIVTDDVYEILSMKYKSTIIIY